MLSTVDLVVLIALALGVVGYFLKPYLLNEEGTSAGFSAPMGEQTSRNLIDTLKKNNKNCVIFFGSQTGTAEDYASKLSKELRSKFGLQPLLADLADYDFDNLNELDENVLCFFMMATYGEGEPTDNAVDFFEYLDNGADNLSNLKFTVFGLGNSTYEFYNASGKKVNEKLEELGAERFGPHGEGDDGAGTMDEDFLSWKESIITSLKENLNFEEKEAVYQPSIKIVESDVDYDDENVSHGEPSEAYLKSSTDVSKGPFDHTHPYLSQIGETRELFRSKTRKCVHVEFDIGDSNMRYTTGDHIAVWPSNSNENIEKFVEAFDLKDKLNSVFELRAIDSTVSVPFHTPISYGAVVRHHLEVSGPVSRQFLLAIAQFAPDAESKSEMLRISNSKEAFAQEVHEKKYNIADALMKISNGRPWNTVPFEFIIESIPHLQPRYYSISSSSITEKTKVHITAVVEAEDVEGREVTGVVTNLLKNIDVAKNTTEDKIYATYDLKGPRNLFSGFKLPVHIRRSTFKMPSNPATPIVLIGPGTGVAPFRGFVRERIALKEKNNSPVGKIVLFYGCRNENEDYLYKDEWPSYAQKLGTDFEMHVAFSRKDPSKKEYVQHILSNNSAKINTLLAEGAYLYVCGDASRMARDVHLTLTNIVSKERGLDIEKAADLLRSMKLRNVYQEDVW